MDDAPVDGPADAAEPVDPAEPADEAPESEIVATAANPQGLYNDHLKPQPIEHELKTSYLDYSMSVIVGRAIPDVRDGLKPVHRRILYAMKELGVTANSAYKKSARTVGEVLGKFHPHGDTAVYDAMVRMAQDFSLRYPLVDGQGNFGSVDGDGAAAMRYTESRLARIAGELLEDIDKETVAWRDNFDGSLQEPSVLPGKLPNLLINGSDGIAVGMATKIPPHNLTEICDAIVRLIDDPDVTIPDLMEHVRGPDFPTGGIICGVGGIYSAYMTGRGRVIVRARTEVEQRGGDKEAIIITELPYQVNKANLLISIAGLVKEKRIEGISDLRDESDRTGMRVVIELKRGVVTDVVLNQLFAHTQMQTTFGVNNLVLHHGQPKTMDLKQTLTAYLDHREDVIVRRTEFDLRKAEEKLHLIDGLLIALDNIERVIEIIRGSRDAETAKAALMAEFGLSELQCKAILDMRLSKLTGLEVEQLQKDRDETAAFIERCQEILGSKEERLKIIRDEVLDLKTKYGDARRTEISEMESDVLDEDLIPREDVIVTMTRDGYIKRMGLDTYRAQHRGGKGLRGMTTKEEDEIQDLMVVHSHDWVMYFTDKGKVFWLKGYRIPEGSRQSKGKAIVNLLEGLEGDERVIAAVTTSDFPEDRYLMFATRNGTVKRTQLSAYKNVRTSGIKAIVLDEGDSLTNVRDTDGTKLVLLASKSGQACLFKESDCRPMGRVSRGVRGIRLGKADEVVSMAVFEAERFMAVKGSEADAVLGDGDDTDDDEPDVDPDLEGEADDEGAAGIDPAGGPYVLVITEKGFGKATPLTEYRLTHRGGKGVKNVTVTRKNGPVVAIRAIYGDEDLLLTTGRGMVTRIRVGQVRVTGRAAQGVIVMRPPEGDFIQAVALLPPGDDSLEGELGDGANPDPGERADDVTHAVAVEGGGAGSDHPDEAPEDDAGA